MTTPRVYIGGPADGLTNVSGGDVVYFMDMHEMGHRYQWDRDCYRYQGKRNVKKNGIDNYVTIRVCLECATVREDYISTVCPVCYSKRWRRA